MPDSSIESNVISQIALMQSVVMQLPDSKSILSLSCRGLLDIPGVDQIDFEEISDENQVKDATASDDGVTQYVVQYHEHRFAKIFIRISDTHSWSLYAPYVENYFTVIAVALENRRQTKINQSLLSELEERIEERTSELSKKNQEYIELNNSLEDALSKLRKTNQELIFSEKKAQESDRLKSAFLSNMSHEIRTPMNGILGFAELLKTPNLGSEEIKDYIHIIESSGRRMLHIIEDLIDISKIESDQVELKKTYFSMDNLIEELQCFFVPIAQSKNLSLMIKTPSDADTLLVEADRLRVTQVFSNLIDNAVKFTNRGTVAVGYKLEQGRVLCFVSDTGIGVPSDEQRLIFNRFYQQDNSMARQFEGAGLGLALSKAYVDLHDGNIWVDSDGISRSTFWFEIPCKVKDSVLEDQADKAHVETSVENNDFAQPLKVLIAEDDEINFRYMKHCMPENVTIVWARNGEEVVRFALRDNDYDLILMDVRMPFKSGLVATTEIKAVRPDLPIIAQSAHAGKEDIDAAMKVGCDDYLTKPITREKLLEAIKPLMKTSKS